MRSCSSAASATSFNFKLFSANDRGKRPSFIIHGVQSSKAPPLGIKNGVLWVQVANSVFLRGNPLHPIVSAASSSSSSEAQIQPPDQDESRNLVHVIVQLQKECQFGQQFLVSGDHPRLGSWSPLDAVPMNWSQGHVWTAELDLCVGELIQFKFILRENSGKMLWQPGPDRVFQTWETNSRRISVFGDWESAALFQQVMESDELMVLEKNPPLNGHDDSVYRNQVMDEISNELCTSNKGLRRENNSLQNKGDIPCLTMLSEDLTPKEEKVKFELDTKNGQAELDQKQEEEDKEEDQEKKEVSAELMFNKEHAQINHPNKRGFANGAEDQNRGNDDVLHNDIKFRRGQETLRAVLSKLGIL